MNVCLPDTPGKKRKLDLGETLDSFGCAGLAMRRVASRRDVQEVYAGEVQDRRDRLKREQIGSYLYIFSVGQCAESFDDGCVVKYISQLRPQRPFPAFHNKA